MERLGVARVRGCDGRKQFKKPAMGKTHALNFVVLFRDSVATQQTYPVVGLNVSSGSSVAISVPS